MLNLDTTADSTNHSLLVQVQRLYHFPTQRLTLFILFAEFRAGFVWVVIIYLFVFMARLIRNATVWLFKLTLNRNYQIIIISELNFLNSICFFGFLVKDPLRLGYLSVEDPVV